MKAAFEGAAEELQGSEVKLAIVDVTQEKDLAKELNATSPPMIRLYLSGDKHNPVSCPGTCKKNQQILHMLILQYGLWSRNLTKVSATGFDK